MNVQARQGWTDRGETKLVVQEAQRFEPDGDEIARASKAAPAVPAGPFEVAVDPARWNEALFDEVKAVLEHHRGDSEVLFVVGERRYRAGEQFKVRPSSGLRTELDHVLGHQALAA